MQSDQAAAAAHAPPPPAHAPSPPVFLEALAIIVYMMLLALKRSYLLEVILAV